MSWKKNVCSYVLWAVYLAAVGVTVTCVGISLGERAGLPGINAAVGAAVLLFIVILLLYAVMDRLLRASYRLRPAAGVNRLILEGLAVTVLVAAGIVLRVAASPYAGEEAAYYDIARVVEDGAIPQVAHGATYFYLRLLRLLFILAGNRWMAGIWLQIALQAAACIVLFLAVRKLAGSVSAVVMTGFMMLSPERIAEGVTYSPRMLYLCIYAIGLLGVAFFLEKRARGRLVSIYDIILLIFLGALLGLVCYLDITGVTLLILAGSVLTLKKAKSHNLWGSSLLECGVLLLSTLGFFAGYLLLDSIASGKRFGGVWQAWRSLYLSKGYLVISWARSDGGYIMLVLMAVLLAFGVIHFWSRKDKWEYISPWILTALVAGGMEFFCVTASDMARSGLFFVICSVLAGIGIRGFWLREMQGEGMMKMSESTKRPGQNGPESELEDELVVLEEGNEPMPKVKLIENPLPLPRKHVKKVMGYGFEPDEAQMSYDVAVSDEDDFDIR